MVQIQINVHYKISYDKKLKMTKIHCQLWTIGTKRRPFLMSGDLLGHLTHSYLHMWRQTKSSIFRVQFHQETFLGHKKLGQFYYYFLTFLKVYNLLDANPDKLLFKYVKCSATCPTCRVFLNKRTCFLSQGDQEYDMLDKIGSGQRKYEWHRVEHVLWA